MKISNTLCNNGYNTLMQYLMTISYQSFVPYVKFSTILYVTFALWHELSVCLSSVTLLRPTQRVKIFVNIFATSNSLGTWAVCVRYA